MRPETWSRIEDVFNDAVDGAVVFLYVMLGALVFVLSPMLLTFYVIGRSANAIERWWRS